MSLISRLHHIYQGTHEDGYDGTIMEFEDPEVKKYLVENIGVKMVLLTLILV